MTEHWSRRWQAEIKVYLNRRFDFFFEFRRFCGCELHCGAFWFELHVNVFYVSTLRDA